MPHGRAPAQTHPEANSEDLAGASVTLMGLGGFGGGLGAARWLAEQGADVLVTDLRPADALESSLNALAPMIEAGRISLRLGEHNVSDFTTADLVVANPAVPKPWDNRFLRAARAAGIPITTEVRLLVERLPRRNRVIGVTGTAGKSTTSSMIHHLLAHAGIRVHLGGNLGGSLLTEVDRIEPEDWVVLELSSAQLHWLERGAGHPSQLGWSPGIAVVTNLAPNHEDWHGSFQHYASCKQQIVRDQQAGDHLVLPVDLQSWGVESPIGAARTHVIGPGAQNDLPKLSIPGAHNRLNAAFALTTVSAAGEDASSDPLALFRGLPHRLQFVGSVPTQDAGFARAFNDSKCTTPEAAALAVDAFSARQGEVGEAHVHLICGGYDKMIDLAPLAAAGARCGHCYTIGATGPSLARAITARGGSVTNLDDLDEAAACALARIRDEGVILLAPGCASWDQFKSYEERGDHFASLILAVAANRSSQDDNSR